MLCCLLSLRVFFCYRSLEGLPLGRVVTSLTGETLIVRKSLEEKHVRDALQKVKAAGIQSIAVVLKHSALFSEHEEMVGRVAQQMGLRHVSLSSSVMKMVKMVARGFTAAADAYLTPHIMEYLQAFQSGFDEGLKGVELSFMQSDGGLSPADAFCGHKAVLSGPAAGYVGYATTTTAKELGTSSPVQVRLKLSDSMHA
jgi:5-oxoprolinase (ATP-hydrolysing)